MKNFVFGMLPSTLYLRLKHGAFKKKQPVEYQKLQQERQVVTEEGYSYKPFVESESIFIHIPKCAGVSINKTLYGNLAGGHKTLNQYVKIFTPDELQHFFKFTIVRNPWDRLVSAYHFLEKGGLSERDKAFFDSELKGYRDFNDFVLRWVSPENIHKAHHFRPQHHYILERYGKITLDFVGFVENMESDFAYIAKNLGKDCMVKSTNRSDHKKYTDYYTEETKQIVADVYQKDIALLGYNFDNTQLETQIKQRDELYKQ